MPDPNASAADGGNPAGGAPAPATGTPPATGAPPETGTPPAATGGQPPRAAAPPKPSKPGKPQPKNGSPSRPQSRQQRMDHKAWLEHQVESRMVKTLGVTVEEARALIEAGRNAQPGGQSAPTAPAAGAPAGIDPRKVQKILEENAQLQQRVEKQKSKIKKIKRRAADSKVALELENEAISVGILQEHADFAMEQYKKLFAAYTGNAASVAPEVKAAFDKDVIDGRAIFAWIKKQRPYLGGAQPTVALAPTTAPPATNAPGEETPNPAAAGTPPKRKDAMQMSDDEWRQHKRRLGFVG